MNPQTGECEEYVAFPVDVNATLECTATIDTRQVLWEVNNFDRFENTIGRDRLNKRGIFQNELITLSGVKTLTLVVFGSIVNNNSGICCSTLTEEDQEQPEECCTTITFYGNNLLLK